MTSSVVELRSSQSLTCTNKKATVTIWWSADHLYSTDDPVQLSASWQNHYIWEVCSANQWDAPNTAMPAAGIGQQNGPSSSPQHLTALGTTKASEAEQFGLWHFASSTIFTWHLANWLPLLQASPLFVSKALLQPTGCTKCILRVCQIPKHGFLHYRNK